MNSAVEAPHRVAVLSLHPLYDTRIGNHLATLCGEGLEVTYLNRSELAAPSWPKGCGVTLMHREPRSGRRSKILRYLATLSWFWRQSRRTSADLFHIHDVFLLPLVVPLKLGTRGRLVFDVHEHYRKIPGWIGWFSRLAYALLPLVDGLVGVSPSVLPRSSRPSVLVPNYQRSSEFEHRREAGDTIEVVYIGSLSQEDRDVGLMLDAAQIVLGEIEGVRFKIGGRLFGPGAEATGARLEQMAAAHGRRFRWLGKLSRKEVLRESASADVGLWLMKDCPNLYGASPNKIFEYLAGGVALLATEGFEISSRVRDSGAGVLVPAGTSSAELAAQLSALVGDRDRLERAKAAAASLGREYDWDRVAVRYVELYERLWGESA